MIRIPTHNYSETFS
jgi:dynein heavy chain